MLRPRISLLNMRVATTNAVHGLRAMSTATQTSANPSKTASTAAKPATSFDTYCLSLVRERDFDNYLCGLYVPAKHRRAYYAIRAYNVELAVIRDTVKEANIARMRFQWWREAIQGVYKGRPVDHPVVQALAQHVTSSRTSKAWLDRVLDTREADFEIIQPQKLKDVEEYAEGTQSALLYAMLEVAGIRNIHADHMASHIGKAVGICTVLRGTGWQLTKKHVYFPMELTAKYKVSADDLFHGRLTDPVASVVLDMATVAKAHMDHMKKLKVDPIAIPYMMQGVIADRFLTQLEKKQFNVFDPSLGQRSLWLQVALMRRYLKKSWQ